VLAIGCSRSQPDAFRLDSFVTGEASTIPLNRPLIFQFRGDLVDPASVQSASLAIEEISGSTAVKRPVEGRYEVTNDNRVIFFPKVASRSNLSDGGLRPGCKYRVVVSGFPSASGIRSVRGQVLTQRHIFTFSTLSSGRELFEDLASGSRAILTTDQNIEYGVNGIPVVQVNPGDKLRLLSTKPLRPDTVTSANITVRTGPRDEQKLPFDVQLANDENGARIELDLRVPLDPGVPALVEIDTNVTDLGGNICQGPLGTRFFWSAEPAGFQPLPIVQEFLRSSDQERPAQRDANVATASWRGDGRLSVHFPALAADGSDGYIKWTGQQIDAPKLVRARRIEIGDVEVRVRSGTVLTAQSGIVCGGKLRFMKDQHVMLPEQVALGVPADTDVAFIAGGDIYLDGEFSGAANVLVASGGAVWISNTARFKCKKLKIVAPGGALVEGDVPADREISRVPLPNADRVQLADPLVFRAASQWVRAGANSVTFGGSQWLGDAGSARVAFRYRSARSVPGQMAVDPKSISNWAPKPEDLPAGDRLQFSVDFIIPESPASQLLRLPFVDRLSIATRRY
jgi:hypothetical protein